MKIGKHIATANVRRVDGEPLTISIGLTALAESPYVRDLAWDDIGEHAPEAYRLHLGLFWLAEAEDVVRAYEEVVDGPVALRRTLAFVAAMERRP